MINTGDVVDYYKYRQMPWMSKSRLLAYNHCPFSFYLGEVVGAAPRNLDEEMEEKGIIGTNAHLVMALFWDVIKKKNMIDDFMRIKIEINPKNSQLYWAFYAVCEEIIPKETRGMQEFSNVLSNFAEFQVENWIAVTQNIGSTKEAYEKYWLPIGKELFLEDFTDMMYGTIDVLFRNPNYKNDKKPYLFLDYKTGNVPKAVSDFQGDDAFSVRLPTSKLEELHFYAWLMAKAGKEMEKSYYLCANGVQKLLEDGDFAEKECGGIVDMNNNIYKCRSCGREWKTPHDDLQRRTETYYDPVYPEISSYQDLIGCMVFLGGNRPLVAPKKMNNRTMTNVLASIQEIRDMWNNKKDIPNDWKKNVSDFVCPRCFQGATCSEWSMREMLST